MIDDLESKPVFSPSKIGDYWSEWRGRVFSFPKKKAILVTIPDNLMGKFGFFVRIENNFYSKYGMERTEKALSLIREGDIEGAKRVLGLRKGE